MQDFTIQVFEGQRVAVPNTERAFRWLQAFGAQFDMSDDGIELDTSDDAYDAALAVLNANKMTVGTA